ncbi:MAG: hypothetical protein JW759_02215 [Candidatus Coatesbacteria bacterium]|nr:hypothetical protein [Candidatus Coatesbacteria bacterium]
MRGKELYIFVEGPDDKRFVERVITPLLKTRYSCVRPRQYSNERHKKLKSLFNGIEENGDDCIVIGDYDRGPCITAATSRIRRRTGAGASAKVAVAVKAIEAWYLAGLDQSSRVELGINTLQETTDHISKGRFNRLIPKRYDSRVHFMIDILRSFSVETATMRNVSFGYFISKYCS